MSGNRIDQNKIAMSVNFSRQNQNRWVIVPSLTAYPNEEKSKPVHYIFLLDSSGSMDEDLRAGRASRWEKVIKAMLNVLKILGNGNIISIINFNSTATVEIEETRITSQTTSKISGIITKMGSKKPRGDTYFKNAFNEARTLIRKNPNVVSRIIFLTDGVDSDRNSAEVLWSIFRLLDEPPRIFPIGILISDENDRTYLNELFSLSGGQGESIFIENDGDGSADDYIDAFDKVVNAARLQTSEAAAQLTVAGNAKDGVSSATFNYQRQLGKVLYDGQPHQLIEMNFFPFPLPSTLSIRLECDGAVVAAECTLSSDELVRAEHQGGYQKPLKVKSLTLEVKGSEHQQPSLQAATGQTGGVANSARVVTAQQDLAVGSGRNRVAVPAPELSLQAATGQTDEAADSKKVVIPQQAPPMVPRGNNGGAPIAKKGKQAQLTRHASETSSTNSGLKKCCSRTVKKMAAGTVFAGGGAAAGFFGGSAAATSSVVIATGISPPVFIAVCAAGGAVVLPLLVYLCMQVGRSCTSASAPRLATAR